MNQVYVGVDLGSSAFQQVAMKTDGLGESKSKLRGGAESLK
jgi:hypothetical protein